MDEITKAIGAYRACIDDLPDDLTEDELKREAETMLRHARDGASLVSLTGDIANGLANRIQVRTLSHDDCVRLANALLELANASRT
ncbi:MAG TPA: hypothetical protein VMI72_14385 [Roseiarcus sp.]|nr:hypothetical protein [Roseiarcus sp.]